MPETNLNPTDADFLFLVVMVLVGGLLLILNQNYKTQKTAFTSALATLAVMSSIIVCREQMNLAFYFLTYLLLTLLYFVVQIKKRE